MLKAELHSHTSDDPSDPIPYDAVALIDRAARLGYQVLAITLHDKQRETRDLDRYARQRGVVLIPGVERTICGKHVLLLNFREGAEDIETFEALRSLKARSDGLVIAPHPFFPGAQCLGAEMDRCASLIDAVEVNAFYTRTIDFNRRAVAWARAHGKPMVGNGDVHRLSQLGTTYSLIDADSNADAVCQAIRAGRVEVRRQPISILQAASVFGSLLIAGIGQRTRPSTASPGRSAPAVMEPWDIPI